MPSQDSHTTNAAGESVAGENAAVDFYNQYQFDDLLARSQDVYASAKYEVILQFLRPYQGLRILNAGCGSGELSFALAAAGHHVVGIDPTPEYIALAQQHACSLVNCDCVFSVSTIEEFASDALFDCVVATDVLEHIEHDDVAYDSLTAHCKLGGLVIVTVPASQWLFGYHDESLGHFRRYSLTQLQHLVTTKSAVLKLRYFGFTLIPVSYLYSKLLRKPYPVAAIGNGRQSPLRSAIVRRLLRFDTRVEMPIGTSLIFIGRRV